MEKENTNKPLATESFSYSWLTHQKPSSSNCEIKFFEQSFDFDVPGLTSHSNFVHADEIFSDGRIMPVYVERSRLEASKASNFHTAPQVSIYHPSSPSVSRNMRTRYYLLGKWRKSSRKIMQKCMGFVRPLVGSSRINSRVDDLDRKVSEVRSRSNSCGTSPRPSSVSKKIDLFRIKSGKSSPNISPSRSSNACFESHDADNSIHEAILYCKRSIGK